jgi:hypothetical protein
MILDCALRGSGRFRSLLLLRFGEAAWRFPNVRASNEHLLILLVSPRRSGQVALDCAHRTSTFLSIMFPPNLLVSLSWKGTHVGLRAAVERGPSEGARSGSTGPTWVSFLSYCWIAESSHFPSWDRMKVQASPDSVGISSLPSMR